MKKEKGSFVHSIKSFFNSLKEGVTDYFTNFKNGDINTKLSYIIMGYGCLSRKQIG